jgi:hypothetical protein
LFFLSRSFFLVDFQACANNIRSGWRTIFSIFEIAAVQKNIEVSKIAFEIIERLMNSSFELLIYDFVELMNCLVVFVSCHHTALSLKSLVHLEKCAQYLSTGDVVVASLPSSSGGHHHSSTLPTAVSVTPSDHHGIPSNTSPTHTTHQENQQQQQQIGEDSSIFRLWWPLLLGLSTRVASDHRLQVRSEALDTLRRILFTYGHIFSAQTWSVIFKGVLFPVIDSATQADEHWINTMTISVLTTYNELFLKFLENDTIVPMLNDLLIVFSSCICQENLTLSSIAIRVLKDLLLAVGITKTFPSASISKSNSRVEKNKEVKLFERSHLPLITKILSTTLVKTLIFSYSDLGSLEIGNDTTASSVKYLVPPSSILQMIMATSSRGVIPSHQEKRRSSYTDSSSATSVPAEEQYQIVITPYGQGKLVEVS